MKNTVIVVDAGGRGSVLVDAYAKSPHVDRIIAIPGNDLMQINTKLFMKLLK
jgi:phosphoribosylamine-glycine ligase